MSEETKNGAKLRFNLLDVALILLLVLCIVSVWQRDNLQKLFEDNGEAERYVVTFRVDEMRASFAERLTADTVVYFDVNGSNAKLGTLREAVSVADVAKEQDTADALKQVNGTLSCMILVRDNCYWLESGAQLAINQRLAVRTETLDFEILITNIQKLS